MTFKESLFLGDSMKKKKLFNSWHKTLYGPIHARENINAPAYHKKAKKEVKFLIQTFKLDKSQTILDVACGTGRHSLIFGKKGFSTTGVDINDLCVRLAKKNCKGLKTVQIKKGDMKKLGWAKNKFDLVINLYTSFGYFKTDKENKKSLNELVKAVRPGGRLVIQTMNRDWLLKVYCPVQWEENTRYSYLAGRKYDSKTHYTEGYICFVDKKTGQGEMSYHRIRLYSIDEMKKLLKLAGLVNIKMFGNIEGGPLNKYSSSHPVYIGKKPKI